MTKRIIFTAVLVVIGFGSFFFGSVLLGSDKPKEKESRVEKDSPAAKRKSPVISFLVPDIETGKDAPSSEKDESSISIQKTLTEKSKQILGIWATLKVINGVINVLQSAQIGGSFFVEASVNPLEFLAPIDNVLDKISNLLLWALGAILFEKILLAISGYIVFLVVIPVCAVVAIVTVWTYKNRSNVHKVVMVSVLIGLIIPLAIPISFQVSTLLEKKILTNSVKNVISSIEEKNKTAESMEEEITGLRRIGKSIIGYMTNAKDLGNALIEDMINFFIIFIFTNIVIPILTIFGLYFLTKYFAKVILR